MYNIFRYKYNKIRDEPIDLDNYTFFIRLYYNKFSGCHFITITNLGIVIIAYNRVMKTNSALSKRKQKPKNHGVVRIIRKSNKLVEARYKLDIWETRIFTKMLMIINKGDDDFKKYKIYLKDLVDDFNLGKNQQAYPLLRQGARKLMRKVFYLPYKVDGVDRLFEAPLVTGLDSAVTDGRAVRDDHLYIEVSFAPEMKPYLIQLKSQFTMYDARNILKLPSTYSIRIYELLKQYEKIGKRTFELDELKHIIGVKEEIEVNGKKEFKDSYPMYGNFRQRVLLKAQKDLKKYTDIQFTFEPKRTGRKTTHLIFYIELNQDIQKKFVPNKAFTENTDDQQVLVEELHQMVLKWIAVDVVQKWVSTLPEKQIRKGIAYTLMQIKSGKEISNVAGYLQKMVRTANLTNPILEKQQKKAAKKSDEKANQEKLAGLEAEVKKLMANKHQKEKALVDIILTEQPDIKDTLLEQAKQRVFSGYDATKTVAENLETPIFASAFHNTVLESFKERFTALNKAYDLKIGKLKRAINHM